MDEKKMVELNDDELDIVSGGTEVFKKNVESAIEIHPGQTIHCNCGSSSAIWSNWKYLGDNPPLYRIYHCDLCNTDIFLYES